MEAKRQYEIKESTKKGKLRWEGEYVSIHVHMLPVEGTKKVKAGMKRREKKEDEDTFKGEKQLIYEMTNKILTYSHIVLCNL